jgi:hypothetical protein
VPVRFGNDKAASATVGLPFGIAFWPLVQLCFVKTS